MLSAMSTDARILARRYYEAAERDLAADMAALSANPEGVVVFLPQLVALMKPAKAHSPEEWGKLGETPVGADGWYVHLLVGDLALARRLAWLLPGRRWLCFQRGRRNAAPHRLPLQRIRL